MIDPRLFWTAGVLHLRIPEAEGRWWHLGFESLAYLTGLGLWLWRKRGRNRLPTGLAFAALVGALLGAKILFIAQHLTVLNQGPEAWIGGKTVVGGFLGGWLGIEWAKTKLAIKGSTGDGFLPGMALGLILGRMGCFCLGLADATTGTPTDGPWGVDFGDGLARHPTALYEMIIVASLFGLTRLLASDPPGRRFRVFMLGYLGWRFLVGFIQPVPFSYAGLSAIQWVSLTSVVFIGWHLVRTVQTPIPTTGVSL